MAMLQVHYYSNSMRREVTFNAIIPLDDMVKPGQVKAENKPLKALYLLNGHTGSHTDWMSFTNIRALSNKHRIAVFMPAGENHFYVDDVEKGSLYGEYIGNELVAFTREMFPLSLRREDTFIGGLSMGGYGAIRNGLKYPENFSRIIALSSALITYKIAGAKSDYNDGVADYKYFKSVFGDLDELKGSDKDPEALVMDLKRTGATVPKLYMACGTEDFLLDVNRQFHNFLVSEQVDLTYVENPGEHTWDFANEFIVKALDWALQ